MTTIFCLKFTQSIYFANYIYLYIVQQKVAVQVGEYMGIQLDHYYYNCINNERVLFFLTTFDVDHITRHQQIKKKKNDFPLTFAQLIVTKHLLVLHT